MLFRCQIYSQLACQIFIIQRTSHYYLFQKYFYYKQGCALHEIQWQFYYIIKWEQFVKILKMKKELQNVEIFELYTCKQMIDDEECNALFDAFLNIKNLKKILIITESPIQDIKKASQLKQKGIILQLKQEKYNLKG